MKLKTNKAAYKRVKIKKTHLARKKAYKRHLLRRKGNTQLRRLSQPSCVHDADISTFQRMLPYR